MEDVLILEIKIIDLINIYKKEKIVNRRNEILAKLEDVNITKEESFDTYYSDEEITVCCAGGCPDCKRTYLYDEVYKFSHVANIQREE